MDPQKGSGLLEQKCFQFTLELVVTRLSDFGRKRVPHMGPRDSKNPVARSSNRNLGTMRSPREAERRLCRPYQTHRTTPAEFRQILRRRANDAMSLTTSFAGMELTYKGSKKWLVPNQMECFLVCV